MQQMTGMEVRLQFDHTVSRRLTMMLHCIGLGTLVVAMFGSTLLCILLLCDAYQEKGCKAKITAYACKMMTSSSMKFWLVFLCILVIIQLSLTMLLSICHRCGFLNSAKNDDKQAPAIRKMLVGKIIKIRPQDIVTDCESLIQKESLAEKSCHI